MENATLNREPRMPISHGKWAGLALRSSASSMARSGYIVIYLLYDKIGKRGA
jgi:hypothetical protein